MASFKETFSREGTLAQSVTTDPASRAFGGVLKIAGLATAGAIIVSAAPLTAPVLAVSGLAAAGYGLGAAVQANSTVEKNAKGQETGFAAKLRRNLVNPFKL